LSAVQLKHIKRATFLCPTLTSGGPEAIHQAVQAFNEVGLASDIAYFGNGGGVSVQGDQLVCAPPSHNPCLDVYAQYEPVLCRSLPLRERHLVVLPEMLAGRVATFPRATVAVWWLSVDNALQTTNLLARRALLANRTLLHFHQSAYAEDYLRRAGVTSSPLGDFTTPEFTDHEPPGPNSEPGIAYNPAKGADLAAGFFAAHPEQVPVPVRGMSREETARLFRRTSIYVDFGHFPGKDRMPREAAASGSVVFLRNMGAGRFHDDFPVPDFFRFTEDDVASGELGRRIKTVQQDPQEAWGQQELLRKGIRSERDDLYAQVRLLRGQHCAA
jgi:hypothetical protein